MITVELPTCLYGTRRETKAASRKIVKAAWKDGNWDRAFAKLEYIPFQDQPGDLVIRDMGSTLAKDHHHWWLFWISELLLEACSTDCDYAKHHHLVLSGMSHCWFTMGFLGTNEITLEFHILEELKTKMFRPALERYVYWLPEFTSLQGHYASGLPTDFFSDDLQLKLMWIFPYLQLCGWLGSPFKMEDVISEYSGDLISTLLDKGIIEPDGDRFRLRDW